jgi:general secretion pathway protein B
MSYILNALRKSEQERQSIQPDSLSGRIIVQQPLRHRKSTRLIIAVLIISNLAILAYFLGFTEKSSPPAPQPDKPADKPVEASRPEIIPPSPAVARLRESKLPPKTEIAAESSEPASPPAVKQAAIKKPTAEIEKPAIELPKPIAEPIEPAETAESDKPFQPEEPAKLEAVKPAPPVKDNLPFLEELPTDFRRSLSDFNINVFGYSSEPSQRFVLIDMVKYVPGQLIKNQMELKEIRENCIVVSYEDRIFKIKRP